MQKTQTLLLNWYKKNGRDLPWRNTTDAYQILVSEIMLQQTQVSRVIEKYHSFLTLFPSWNELANASNADVIHAWAGLGYNRRALALRDIAKHIILHGEPTTRKKWMELKGIGPYTSAALSIFCKQENVLPIDTNIRRVLGRAFLGIPFPQLTDDIEIERIATPIIHHPTAAYLIPQALFDLANGPCSKIPNCTTCPLLSICTAAPQFLSGILTPPKRTTKKTNERIQEGKKYPDRIYRGRILQLVRESHTPVPITHIGFNIDPTFDPIKDQDWLDNIIKRLTKDQLISTSKSGITLPTE